MNSKNNRHSGGTSSNSARTCTTVIAFLPSISGRPVPPPSGTDTRTPLAGFERITSSSAASASSARSTAT
jgi:hypothetical protein